MQLENIIPVRSVVWLTLLLLLPIINNCGSKSYEPADVIGEVPGYHLDNIGNRGSVVIGPTGGTIEVTDEFSGLNGVSLDVPVGAVDSPTKITLRLADGEMTVPNATVVTRVVEIELEGEVALNLPITIRLPVIEEPLPDQDIMVISWSGDDWHFPYLSYHDKTSDAAVAVTDQFSIFAGIVGKRSTEQSDFNLNSDAFQAYRNGASYLDSQGRLQAGGTCYGVSWFVREYWRNYRNKCGPLIDQNLAGQGWSRSDQEAAIAVYLQRLYMDDGPLKDLIYEYLPGLRNNFSAGTFMNSVVKALALTKEPVLVILNAPLVGGHAVLVYGFDESEPSRLQVFDPRNAFDPAFLTCSESGGTCLTHDGIFVIPFISGRGSHMDRVALKDVFGRGLLEGSLTCGDVCRDYYDYISSQERSCSATPSTCFSDENEPRCCYHADNDSCLEGVLTICGDGDCNVTESEITCPVDCKCELDCADRECGPDPVCRQSCGTCMGGKTCNASGQCVSETCVPNCSGRECGLDPVCGQSCGTCSGEDYSCLDSGQCCRRICGSMIACGDDGCGGVCGFCGTAETCVLQYDSYSDKLWKSSCSPLVDNDDGTASDPTRGLTWMIGKMDANGGPALLDKNCDDLVLGGRDDWRLASIDEIRTLISGCPDIEPDGDCNVHVGCSESCLSDACLPTCSCVHGCLDLHLWPTLEQGWIFSSSVVDGMTSYRWGVSKGRTSSRIDKEYSGGWAKTTGFCVRGPD